MIYKSGKNGYYKSYEYAKTILSKMKKITAFKAFSNEEHDYYDVIDNNKNYYNLILFDEASNEYWFDNNCGCKGMGSVYSEKILRLVGIRENYNLDSEKEIYKFNLCPNNQLNLLVVEIDLLNRINKYFINSLISIDFETAYIRYKALDNLQKFGTIRSIDNAVGEDLYVKYFNNYNCMENVCENDGINNILFLDRYLNKDVKSNIGSNIKKLLELERKIYIKEIKKTEYEIYSY
ncbi:MULTISPECIES: hypothetical protein [unclassified Romboutsia]|uniref:hypothetical protein n=1 Tax=unclassified Romboutsia TaxID=2626894 RepID=UPI0008211C0F|nr:MULTISPECIES: hypothetical protein [unclassified Romboutsia]SCH84414.1 Uncharacterised protein [uncultured Clostridium sp.]